MKQVLKEVIKNWAGLVFWIDRYKLDQGNT